MKKYQKKEYESLREELVKQANEPTISSEIYHKMSYSKKRKSTINRIRHKISSLTLEYGDI